MPRYPRHLLPPGVYHVVARGAGGILIFGDSLDYEAFVALLGMAARREGWDVMAYCLMPTTFTSSSTLPTRCRLGCSG